MQKNKIPTIIIKTQTAYKTWHKIRRDLDKFNRYSLGIKIDNYFTEIMEKLFQAQYIETQKKYDILNFTTMKLDTLKFLVLTLLEINGISEKSFLELNDILEETGKMLYGWKQQILKKIETKTTQ